MSSTPPLLDTVYGSSVALSHDLGLIVGVVIAFTAGIVAFYLKTRKKNPPIV